LRRRASIAEGIAVKRPGSLTRPIIARHVREILAALAAAGYKSRLLSSTDSASEG
jgi:threonine dehydratase